MANGYVTPTFGPAAAIFEKSKDRMAQRAARATQLKIQELNQRRRNQATLSGQAYNFDITKLRPGTAEIFQDFQSSHIAATGNFADVDLDTGLMAVNDIRTMFQMLQTPKEYQSAYDDLTNYTNPEVVERANSALEDSYQYYDQDALNQVVQRGTAIYNGGYWDPASVKHTGGMIGVPPMVTANHLGVSPEGQLMVDAENVPLFDMKEWNSTEAFEVTPALRDSYGPSILELAMLYEDEVKQQNTWNADKAYGIVREDAFSTGGERSSNPKALRRRSFFNQIFPKIKDMGNEYVSQYLDEFLELEYTTDEDGEIQFVGEKLKNNRGRVIGALEKTSREVANKTWFPAVRTPGGGGGTEQNKTNYFELADGSRSVVNSGEYDTLFGDTQVESPTVVRYSPAWFQRGDTLDLGDRPNPRYQEYMDAKRRYVEAEAARLMAPPRQGGQGLTEDAAKQVADASWETMGMERAGFTEEPDEILTFDRLRQIVTRQGSEDVIIAIPNNGKPRVITRGSQDWDLINGHIQGITNRSVKPMTIEDFVRTDLNHNFSTGPFTIDD